MPKLPTGLMIHDTRTDVTLQQKLADCCERFKAKFGVWPKMIWLHSETLGSYQHPDGLKLETGYTILRNHFLVGPLPERST